MFKQETNQTVTERIHEIRIERAKQYLTEGDEKVIHVAQRVGYEDPAFSRNCLDGGSGARQDSTVICTGKFLNIHRNFSRRNGRNKQ